MTNVTQLPVELHAEIFSHLQLKDILNCLFVSKCFYNSIRYGPGGVGEIAISDIKGDVSSLNDANIDYYLNLLSDKSKRRIQVLNNLCPNEEMVNRLLGKYDIARLRLSQCKSNILSFIEESPGTFNGLIELKFNIDKELNINDLDVLARKAPNLEVLNINSSNGLKQEIYTGGSFTSLRTLKICSNRDSKYYNSGRSYEVVLNSLISKTVNLTRLELSGKFFENDIKPMLDFSSSLPWLEYLSVEIHQNRYKLDSIHHLPIIKANNLKELSIKSDIYFHEIPLKDSLTSVEAVFFEGVGCSHALQYYGIGENVKRLNLKSGYEFNDDDKNLLEICKLCPNVEELVVTWFDSSLDWLVEVVKTCPKLSFVSFNSIISDYDNDLQPLSSMNIHNICLKTELSPEKKNKLTNLGLNIYDKSSYCYHIFNDH